MELRELKSQGQTGLSMLPTIADLLPVEKRFEFSAVLTLGVLACP